VSTHTTQHGNLAVLATSNLIKRCTTATERKDMAKTAKKSVLTDEERKAILAGAHALEQKADSISRIGWGGKGPIMNCIWAAKRLRSLARKL